MAEKRKDRTRVNGVGSAYRHGGTWTGRAAGYRYTATMEDGTQKTVRKRPTKGGFRTKTEALEWAAAQTLGAEQRSAPTLLNLWQGWNENDMKKLSADKQTAYKKARRRLEPLIARRIDTLTIDDLQGTVNENASSYYTARDMKSLLSHFYQRAMAGGGSTGTVTVNLSRFIVLPTLEEKAPEPFTEEEVSAMWNAYDGGNLFVGYLLLMIYSSMMPCELLACKSDMIGYERHEIYGCGRKTKKRRETPIVFPDFIVPVLEKLCKKSTSKSGGIFGGDEKTFYDAYHAVTKAVGVRDLPPPLLPPHHRDGGSQERCGAACGTADHTPQKQLTGEWGCLKNSRFRGLQKARKPFC